MLTAHPILLGKEGGGGVQFSTLVHYLLPGTAQPQAASACFNRYFQLVGFAPLHLRYITHTRTELYTNTKHLCPFIKPLANRCFPTAVVPVIFFRQGVHRTFCDLFNTSMEHEANFCAEIKTNEKSTSMTQLIFHISKLLHCSLILYSSGSANVLICRAACPPQFTQA